MRIRRIRICNFRKLLGPVDIEGLGDGLTVIAGDNEEGKSTILAAVQAAFFNRHRLTGEAANAMQPYGSAVRPEIGIDFELNGERYALRKAFCQRPEAELIGPAGRSSGDAVEEQLQALLRFEPPGRGATRPEHCGTWGLFWVDQGTSFARPHLGGSGRETLIGALESEVGQVLGGERGRALIAAIAQQSDAFFTPTGRPTGALKEARDRLAALKLACDEIGTKLGEYDSKTDALAKLRARLRSYKDDRSLETAETKLRSAREAQQALDALEHALTAAETEAKLAKAAFDSAQTAWQTRADKIAAIGKQVEREQSCEQTLQLKAQALTAAAEERNRLQSAYDLAKSAFRTAEAVWDAGERALQRARAQRELQELRGHCGKATGAQGQSDRLRAQAEAIRIDDKAVEALRGHRTAAETARLRLQAIATRLQFEPEGVRAVLREGTAVAPDQPLLLTEPTRLTLEGFGAVIVTPGGEDLAPLRRDAERADERLADALQRLGVANVDEAERLLRQRGELLAGVREQQAIVNAHAPDGLDALRQRLSLKEAEAADLAAGTLQAPLDLAEAERQRNEARKACDDTKTTLAAAENALKAAERSHSAMRDQWLTTQADLNNARRQRQDSEKVLDDERARSCDAALREAVTTTATAHRWAVTTFEGCRAAIENSNPEAVRLKLKMSEQALISIRADIEKLTGQAGELEIELRTLGQAGLGEQLAETAGELERARDHAARIERKAAATRLLLQTLQAAERQAKETFLGPVRARITPYLKLLLPDTEVILADDDLAISHLRRDGVDEPFEQLSIGTREQLAVLTRLAFAGFLRDKGRPAAVILDDALAYADLERFERMQLVLRKAAETLQVIVLTCRERDYLSLGAPIIRLSDCKGA